RDWTSIFAVHRFPGVKRLLATLFFGSAIFSLTAGETNLSSAVAPATAEGTETIVCIRHGEKPAGGLGQLTPRGLNRSLALPEVLLGKFGTPGFVFAPNPTQKVDSKKGGYYYVRPLATIEPTAIRCGLPVNTEFGYREIKGLETELEAQKYRNATVFIAWEHGLLDQFVKNLVRDNGGDDSQVPHWPGSDYDSIFIVKITRSAGHRAVTFTIDHEGLNNLSEEYPKLAQK
ncbi:MAG TPA: hypothetical protein VHH88_13065, partial [Verrucomicrobiae bacterium]|nr:hypothetical protein [Verrucomicrobiae bacterium]